MHGEGKPEDLANYLSQGEVEYDWLFIQVCQQKLFIDKVEKQNRQKGCHIKEWECCTVNKANEDCIQDLGIPQIDLKLKARV